MDSTRNPGQFFLLFFFSCNRARLLKGGMGGASFEEVLRGEVFDFGGPVPATSNVFLIGIVNNHVSFERLFSTERLAADLAGEHGWAMNLAVLAHVGWIRAGIVAFVALDGFLACVGSRVDC